MYKRIDCHAMPGSVIVGIPIAFEYTNRSFSNKTPARNLGKSKVNHKSLAAYLKNMKK